MTSEAEPAPNKMFARQQSTVSNPSELPLNNPDAHWERIFAKYDQDGNGYISVSELRNFIDSHEYQHDIPDHVVTKIYEMSDANHDGKIDYQEFIQMIHNPELKPLFENLLNKYVRMVVPKFVHYSSSEIDGIYEDQYRCCPPPIGMILISIVEIILYSVDAARGTTQGNGPVAEALMYDPHRRYEAWRYITYMFVHIGVLHLVVNLLVQVLLGTPLEMVHRWWRVLVIYFAGVIAGSLGTSITDPTVRLAGASGGVYSLITAHISTIIMNWKEMEFPLIQLLIFLIITACDVGTAIYNRYVLDLNENIGYAAHFAGAVAGLLVGINILRNFNVTKTEKIIWWISIITYITLMLMAIIWNAAVPNYFPKSTFKY